MLIDTNTYCEIIIKILCCWINVSYIFVQICGQAIASSAHDLACSFIYFCCCGVLIIKYNWKHFVIIRNNPGSNALFFPFSFFFYFFTCNWGIPIAYIFSLPSLCVKSIKQSTGCKPRIQFLSPTH